MREIDTVVSTSIEQMSGSLIARYHIFDPSRAYGFMEGLAG